MNDAAPKTLSIPEAGSLYFGLSRNGSYDAAERGEIPYIQIGRLKRVPVLLMERKMAEASAAPQSRPAPPPAPSKPNRRHATAVPHSTAVRRRRRSNSETATA